MKASNLTKRHLQVLKANNSDEHFKQTLKASFTSKE